MSEQAPYHTDGIPGGHECPFCGEINSCFFVSGYYETKLDGSVVHEETIECEFCGNREIVTW